MCNGYETGLYGLSSLSEKTKKLNHLQMSFQRKQFLFSNLMTLIWWPPARQPCAHPIEFIGRWLIVKVNDFPHNKSLKLGAIISPNMRNIDQATKLNSKLKTRKKEVEDTMTPVQLHLFHSVLFSMGVWEIIKRNSEI